MPESSQVGMTIEMTVTVNNVMVTAEVVMRPKVVMVTNVNVVNIRV